MIEDYFIYVIYISKHIQVILQLFYTYLYKIYFFRILISCSYELSHVIKSITETRNRHFLYEHGCLFV